MSRKVNSQRKTFDVSRFHYNLEVDYYSKKNGDWVNFIVLFVSKTKLTGFIYIRYPNGSTKMGNVIQIKNPSSIRKKRIGCENYQEHFKNRDSWILNPKR
jgi:hypothetical protein